MKDVFNSVGFVRPRQRLRQSVASQQPTGGQPTVSVPAEGVIPMAVDPPLPIHPPSLPLPPPTEDPIVGTAEGVIPLAEGVLPAMAEASRRVDEAESDRRRTPLREEVEISSDPSNQGSASNRVEGDTNIPEGLPLEPLTGHSSRKRGRAESSIAGSYGFGRSKTYTGEEKGLFNIDGEEALQLLSGRSESLDIRRLEPLSDKERES